MKTLIRWQPMHNMTLVRRQFDQLLDELSQVNLDSTSIKSREGAPWIPAIEVDEQDHEITVRAELPGVTAENLDIEVTREAVSITGENPTPENSSDQPSHLRSEFRYGKFRRVIPLRFPVQNDQVKADLKDGILTLTLPKAESERAVKINLGVTQVSE